MEGLAKMVLGTFLVAVAGCGGAEEDGGNKGNGVETAEKISTDLCGEDPNKGAEVFDIGDAPVNHDFYAQLFTEIGRGNQNFCTESHQAARHMMAETQYGKRLEELRDTNHTLHLVYVDNFQTWSWNPVFPETYHIFSGETAACVGVTEPTERVISGSTSELMGREAALFYLATSLCAKNDEPREDNYNPCERLSKEEAYCCDPHRETSVQPAIYDCLTRRILELRDLLRSREAEEDLPRNIIFGFHQCDGVTIMGYGRK